MASYGFIKLTVIVYLAFFVKACVANMDTRPGTLSLELTKTPPSTQLIASTPTREQMPPSTEVQVTEINEWSLPSPRIDFAWAADSSKFVALPAGSSTGYPAGGAILYDANSLDKIWWIQPQGITLYLSNAAFSPDGKSLALYAHGIHVVDTSSAPTITELPGAYGPGGCLIADANSLIWLPDNLTIVVGVNDDRQKASRLVEVQIWNAAQSKCVKVLAKVEGTFRSMSLSSDGTYLALGTRQSLILDGSTETKEIGQSIVWNLETNRQTCKIEGALVARFNPTNNLLLVSNTDNGPLAYWDPEKCQLVRDLVDISHPYDFAFSANGQFLAINAGSIWIVDPGTGKTFARIDPPSFSSDPAWYLDTSLSLSPNGRFLLYSAADLPKGSRNFLWEIEPAR